MDLPGLNSKGQQMAIPLTGAHGWTLQLRAQLRLMVESYRTHLNEAEAQPVLEGLGLVQCCSWEVS